MAEYPLVWIDCEMTGLDLSRDVLIELAVVVTDGELNPLDDGIDLLIAPPPGALDDMVEVVTEMHTESGLIEELRAGEGLLTVGEAEDQVLAYLDRFVHEPGRAPLAGNSIATDRSFIARDMPRLDKFLHYRMIDVSSIKELARRWYPKAYYHSPEKHGGHRALADIRESIDEMRYYRRAVFVPPPGPDADQLKAIAADNGRLGTAPAAPESTEPLQ